jgi:hypothetical protein
MSRGPNTLVPQSECASFLARTIVKIVMYARDVPLRMVQHRRYILGRHAQTASRVATVRRRSWGEGGSDCQLRIASSAP